MEQAFPFLHLFPVADIDYIAFGDCFHALKDLAYQLINDPVKDMGRVARLTVTVGLLAGFPVADIPHTLHQPIGIFLAGISLAVGGKGQPRSTMSAIHIPGQKGVTPGVQRDMAFLFGAVGPGSTDMLGRFKQLRRNDLQVGQLLGATFPTPQDARISEITDNATDTGVVPHLTRSCPVALFVQVGGNPLSAEALMHILVKNDPHHGGLGFVDHQIIELMLALVEAPAFHKVIAVWSKAAFEAAALNKLA